MQLQLPPFSPMTLPCPTHPHLPHSIPPLSLSMGPLYMFLGDLSSSLPCYLPFPPFWLLSVCSLFQCLCLYFACLFVLLIRFYLQMRSYGICLSPPGLYHLAQCSPDPSMLSRRIRAPSFFLLHSIPLHKIKSYTSCYENNIFS